MREFWESIQPRLPFAAFMSETMVRLLLAALLGGLIGLERELKRKPAGLRTNMFICFGCAMFTIISIRMAHGTGGDPTRVASNIITGIGFIGAGSILHSRGSVSGLTTAATLFVVASIGMATGAGMYLPAIFATLVILIALRFLGWTERRFDLKSFLTGYAVVSKDPERMIEQVNHIMDEMQLVMRTVNLGTGANGSHRLHFTTEVKHTQHEQLMEKLRKNNTLERVEVLRGVEGE